MLADVGLPENVRARRLALDRMSQQGLADAAGVTIRTVQRVEQGTNTPSVDLAAKLARALGCTVDDLVGGQPDEGCDTGPEQLAPAVGSLVRQHGVSSVLRAVADVCDKKL